MSLSGEQPVIRFFHVLKGRKIARSAILVAAIQYMFNPHTQPKEPGRMDDETFNTLLDLLINEATKDRDDANARGFSLNAKRGVASQVTKLEEAKLWRNSPQAREYYQQR
jgi:hypothetical protein